jgi:hypothetical protein
MTEKSFNKTIRNDEPDTENQLRTLREGSPLSDVLHEVRIVQTIVEMLRVSRDCSIVGKDEKAFEYARNVIFDSTLCNLASALEDVAVSVLIADAELDKTHTVRTGKGGEA